MTRIFSFLTRSPRSAGRQPGTPPPGRGCTFPYFVLLEVSPRPLPRNTPPLEARGGRVGAGEKKGGGREGGRRRDCGRWPGRRDERAGDAVHLFQPGGFSEKADPPLGRPSSPRPRERRPRRAAHPSAPPDNALQLPKSEGRPTPEMPGHGRPEGAGAHRPGPASTSHLSDARPGPPHMDFYNLTSPRPRAAGRSRSRR